VRDWSNSQLHPVCDVCVIDVRLMHARMLVRASGVAALRALGIDKDEFDLAQPALLDFDHRATYTVPQPPKSAYVTG
jgi:hypothetical protein